MSLGVFESNPFVAPIIHECDTGIDDNDYAFVFRRRVFAEKMM